MADYNSSLPVRTETAGDVIIKIADSITPSQQAQVTAARELSVLASAQPGVDIGDVTVNNGSGAGAVNIQDGGNSITVDATNLDIRDLAFATDKVDVSGSSVSVSGSVSVTQGTDPWNENIAQIAGAVPSATNALPSRLTDGTSFYDARQIRALSSATDSVTAVLSVSAGTTVADFGSGTSIAVGSRFDHLYTVTAGKTLSLLGIEASASGKAKLEVFVETGVGTNIYTLYFVQFNSTAEPNMSLRLPSPILVSAGVRVAANLTNKDVAAQDLYSTILGTEA